MMLDKRTWVKRKAKDMKKIIGFLLAVLIPVFGAPGHSQQAPPSTTDDAFANNNSFKGPAPVFNITAFGARAPVPVPSTTATMTAGSATAKLEAASRFQNGDGITISGAGATNPLTTPNAPMVIPVISAGGTATNVNVNAPSGATRYSYKCVARDRFGALTAASPATTTSTGQAALGMQTATISTATLSNDTLTVKLSTTPALAAGMLVQLTGTSSADYAGWYTVATVGSGTFTVTNFPLDSRAFGWTYKQTTTSTGGKATFFYSNHVVCPYQPGVWEYYVYGGPGNATFNLIGQTHANGTLWRETWVDDYGSTYMAHQLFQNYVPLTAPSIATNDPLTTTIVSGGGSTSLTLAAKAGHSVSGATAIFDDGPALTAAGAAAAAAGGTIFIPANMGGATYQINSFTQIPSSVNVWQVGNLALTETISLYRGGVNWHGDWGAGGVVQFATAGHPFIAVNGANPGIYALGNGNNFYSVAFGNSATNGGNDLLFDLPYQNEMVDSAVVTGGGGNAGDFLSQGVVIHSYNGGGNPINFFRTIFSSGPTVDQLSWTPLFHMPANQDGAGNQVGSAYIVRCNECFFNRRGMEEDLMGGQGGNFIFQTIYRQGGITPLLAISNHAGEVAPVIYLTNVEQDTEAASTVAAWGGTSPIIDNSQLFNSSVQFGTDGSPGPFTGRRSAATRNFGGFMGSLPNRYAENCGRQDFYRSAPYNQGIGQNPAIEAQCQVSYPTSVLGGMPIYWPLAAPSISAGAATNGGTLAANTTYYYIATSVGFDGGETTSNQNPPASATTTNTNLTIPLIITGLAQGAQSYRVYRCTGPASNCISGTGGGNSAFNLINTVSATGSLKFNDNGLRAGVYMPKATGTGSTIATGVTFVAPEVVPTPTTVANLPAAATNRFKIRTVYDSTAVTSEGQPCAGGGTNAALAFSNGTVWKCF